MDLRGKWKRFTAAYRKAGFDAGALPACALAWLDLVGWSKKARLENFIADSSGSFQVEDAIHAEKLVQYLARLTLKDPSCLYRVRALSRLLRERKISHDIVIGWKDDAAHTWIEVNGVAIGQKNEPSKRYRVLRRLKNFATAN